MSSPSIPRSFLEAQWRVLLAQGKHNEAGAILDAMIAFDVMIAKQSASFQATIEAKVGAMRQTFDHANYFFDAADVWKDYNRGKLSMTQRDRALTQLRQGLKPARPKASPSTPKQPLKAGDIL